MKEKIKDYIKQYAKGGYTLDEVAEDILLLFGVSGSLPNDTTKGHWEWDFKFNTYKYVKHQQ